MATAAPARPRFSLEHLLEFRRSRYTTLVFPFVTIVGLVIYFSLQNENFFTVDNAINIGRQSSVLLLVALAGTIVILIGAIDLSVGANVTLTSIVAALYVDQFGVLGVIALAVAVGAVVGFANGGLHTALRIPSFLVTLGMLSVLTGISAHLSNGEPVIFLDPSLTNVVNATLIWKIPNVILIALGAVVVLTVVAFRTKFGRYLYAIGGGEPVAALSGVPLSRYKVLAFVVAGALCGLAGAILIGQVGAGTPRAGDPLLLDSIAAVVLGGTALSGGVGGPHRTLLGVLVIATLSNGMDVTAVHPFTQDIVKGAVVIIAVALTIDRKKYAFIK